MKSLLALTCLMAICFVATNAKVLDTRMLQKILHRVKRGDPDAECSGEAAGHPCMTDDENAPGTCDSDEECEYHDTCENASAQDGDDCTTDKGGPGKCEDGECERYEQCDALSAGDDCLTRSGDGGECVSVMDAGTAVLECTDDECLINSLSAGDACTDPEGVSGECFLDTSHIPAELVCEVEQCIYDNLSAGDACLHDGVASTCALVDGVLECQCKEKATNGRQARPTSNHGRADTTNIDFTFLKIPTLECFAERIC